MHISLPENESGTILIVDDDSINRKILGKIFKDKYTIEEAADGAEGIDKILANPSKYTAILLDVMMPVIDGIQVLSVMRDHDLLNVIPTFLITADDSIVVAQKGYELGAMDIIRKPIVPFAVLSRVQSIVELFKTRKQLSEMVSTQQEELYKQAQKIIKLNHSVVEALATAIELRSGESGDHVRRIYKITKLLLEQTDFGKDLTKKEIDDIAMSSVLHDIGKISIPDAILHKPGKFTAEEFEIMKTHSVEGMRILQQIPQFVENTDYHYAMDIALHHHERWDGNGYPHGLRGNEISVWCQVVGLADVYDALSSKRSYKNEFSRDTVREMILNGDCGAFNPKLLKCFVTVEPAIAELYSAKSDNINEVQ